MQGLFGHNSYKENKAISVRQLARDQFYSDPRNEGATLKNSDLDKIVELILEKAEEQKNEQGKDILVPVQEEDEEYAEDDEEEIEATEKIMKAVKRPAPEIVIEEVKAIVPDDEGEEEGVTAKVQTAKKGSKKPEPAKPVVEDNDEGVTQKMPPKKKVGASQQAFQQPIKEAAKEEEDEDEGKTNLANVAKKKPNNNVAYQPNIDGLQLPSQLKVDQRVLTQRLQPKPIGTNAKIEMKIRECYDIKDIKAVQDSAKDHELILFQGKRIIHADTFEDYKNESDYKDNTKLLLKRACQKQTIHKTEIEAFEAQDTTDKVENFLRKYSRYFKDVVNIAQLAKGGEAIVYTLEHSLPDELIIKCPVLTKEQQEKTLATAFNGILYESQTLNLNPHRGHVVNNVEEIILYNEKLGVITNYCVIVERAKYTLENVAAYWSGSKDKEGIWTYENQDFYTSEKLSFYFFQTMIATQYFHFKNIYYGDMKGANLLIFRNQEVKIGDLGISVKLKPIAEGEEDETEYHLKGSTQGYVTNEIQAAISKQQPVKRPILIKNDQFAIQMTFKKTLIALQKLQAVIKDCALDSKQKPYYLDMFKDISQDSGMTLKECVIKWGTILDNDIKFKNKLCEQLKIEYKFLGLPKVHLLLDQKLMANFYLNKQIVYKKEIEEDNLEDKVDQEKFKLHTTGREEKFPYRKPKDDQKDLTEEQQMSQQIIQEQQMIQEKIDFFWALKAAKSTQDDINKELNIILEKELGLERKRINDKMHDFKDFEIKKAIADPKKSFEQIKILDAISGPNNEGFQMELQHKLCFEIAKGIKKNNMANYFLKRVEQIFILEFEEEGKESSFKEQHVKRLKEQIRDSYTIYLNDKEYRHTIQFAFYSYFMYKDLKSKRDGKTRESLLQQIDYLVESMKIFKNLMGENIELQNQMIHKKAIAHMLIKDEENYKKAQEDFKRLYLTKKSLESFHDYAYSFYKWQDKKVESDKIEEKAVDLAKNKRPEEIVLNEDDRKDIKEEVERLMRFKYDLQSGFLLFKEFFNEYYQYVPNYGLENKKIRDRLAYLEYQDHEDQDGKDPVKFLQYFTKFLKQINDNSTEDISQKRTHLHSYETFLPNKSFLKLKYRQFNMEEVDIQKSILSDDVEFLLNQQRDKITLRKLTFHFDINSQVVCIDSEFWNSRTRKLYKTDHYKELKKTEVSIDIPPFVYPIALNIIDAELIKKKQDQKVEKKEGEEDVIVIYEQFVMVQLSNFKIIKITSKEPIYLDIYDKEFSNMLEIEKTQVLFNRLTKPFNDFIIGTFQHYNPVKLSLSIQNYFVKMSKRQYIISLMRYCFKKLQIVNHQDQIQKDVDSLIVYQDKFLFTKELLENDKIMDDIKQGKNSFNWLFSQEKLLNQRKASFKQYMKDVRNHLVYHMREYFTDGETEDLGLDEGEEVQESDAVTSLREQMGKTIDVLKCFDDAVQKMKDGIRQRYKFEVKKVGSNEAGDEYHGTIQLGYSIVDKKAEFKEAGKLDDEEQKIYFHQIGVLLRFTQHKGYKVVKITSIQFGPDYLLIDLEYKQSIIKGDQGAITSLPVPLLASSFHTLLNTYLGDKNGEFNILSEIQGKGDEDASILIAAWKAEMAANLAHNLNLVMKKDKIFPHFMRVIPVPFNDIFQSELYSYQIKGEEEVIPVYNETNEILLHLMLLKIQYKTKTPSNTIRQLKYKTMLKFNPGVLNGMLEEMKATEGDDSKQQLYQFVKEHVFKYHVFDTFPGLLDQWQNSIVQLYDTKEFSEFTNQFFYTSYDYYSISINVIQRQMADLFSVLSSDLTKECIQKIFQIVLARIQGSLNENKDKYISFLAQYYQEDPAAFEKIRDKIIEYITSEYEDDDYNTYEKEFKEYDECGQTIKKIKEDMHPTKHTPQRLPQKEELKTEYTKIITEKLNQVVELLKKVDLAQIFDKSRNVVVIAFTHSAKKQVIEEVNSLFIGNILLKKILLKASRTKHRIFGQQRIIKKYLTSLEDVIKDKPDYINVMERLRVVMNKNLEVTLVEQYDHNYLPKWKEVFNRLDDYHRFTTYDDFELIVSKLALADKALKLEQIKEMKQKFGNHRDHNALDLDAERSEFLENKFVVIDKYPTIKQLKFFYDEAGNVLHIAALYRLNEQDILGNGFDEEGLEAFQKIIVNLGDDEVLDDVSVPEGSINIKSFKLSLGKNGGDRTDDLTFADDFSPVRNPVVLKEKEDTLSRRVLSFSGLRSDKGLLNFNLYFYKCKESPEEKHLFIDQDSDAEDYFNDDQD